MEDPQSSDVRSSKPDESGAGMCPLWDFHTGTGRHTLSQLKSMPIEGEAGTSGRSGVFVRPA